MSKGKEKAFVPVGMDAVNPDVEEKIEAPTVAVNPTVEVVEFISVRRAGTHSEVPWAHPKTGVLITQGELVKVPNDRWTKAQVDAGFLATK